MYEYNCRASKFQRVSSKYAAASRFVKKTISTKHNTPQPILLLAPCNNEEQFWGEFQLSLFCKVRDIANSASAEYCSTFAC